MAPNKPKPDEAVTVIKDFNEFMASSLGRLDEKVNNALEKQDSLSTRFEKLFDHYNNLLERVVNMESKNQGDLKKHFDDLNLRVALLEKYYERLSKESHQSTETIKNLENENDELIFFRKKTEEKIKIALDLFLKICIGAALAYISYKLGIQQQ